MDRAEQAEWMAQWRSAAVALAEQRERDLHDLTDAEALAASDALLTLACETFCGARRWRFCFIGGLTVQRWGEPRLTQDVDLTLLTGFGLEGPYVAAVLDGFAGRRPDAGEFALRHRVLRRRFEAPDILVSYS